MDLVCGFQAKAFDKGIDIAFTLYHKKQTDAWVIAGKKIEGMASGMWPEGVGGERAKAREGERGKGERERGGKGEQLS